MKEAKFKIGSEIHFMENNTPSSGKINGVTAYQGTVSKLNGLNISVPEGETAIEYSVHNSFMPVSEEDCFSSREELLISVFPEAGIPKP